MHNHPTIAGVILTFNEELDLSRALASLQWCNEVIVLDSGSTDSTQSIALHHQARFYIHIQDPPFLITEQRNWALNHCGITSEWVLFLDADEMVTPQLRDLIYLHLSHQPDITAYEMAPRYWFLGKWLKHTQNYPTWHPRLIKRGYSEFTGGVWESFDSNATIGRVEEPYEHYAFSKGIDSWLERHVRYATWEAATTAQYLLTSQPDDLTTARRLYRRRLASHLWPLRPPMRFFEKYFLNLGMLDGYQGLLYSLLMFYYELIIVVKIIELRRKKADLPL